MDKAWLNLNLMFKSPATCARVQSQSQEWTFGPLLYVHHSKAKSITLHVIALVLQVMDGWYHSLFLLPFSVSPSLLELGKRS